RPPAAVAVDGTSGTVLVQDAAGAARSPGLMYDDRRAADDARAAAEAGAGLWDELGHRPQAGWGLPKARWLVRSGAVGPGDRIVHQADHVAARLTGHPVATDTSNALKTGYDLVRLRWPAEVLDALGLPAELFPEVVRPGTELGRVGAAAAAATGIPAGTPVRAGMTDGCAAQIAARALRPGSWSSALGTTLVVKGSTPQRLRDPGGAVYSHLNPDGGWLPGGASSTGAGVVARDFARADLAALTRAAAAYEPAPGICYPLAGQGERFPFLAPGATGFADGVGAGPAARFAAVLQGIALVERLAYDVLRGLGADTAGPVTFSGGATRNPYWTQLRADVLGRQVLLPAEVQAAAVVAVLAAAPPGELAGTAERMVRIAAVVDPDPVRGARFDDAYDRLRTALADRGWLAGAAAGEPA
ncbi:MAG: carbohydrate kinase, FGGY(), partial [uncultured Corynebacteriales bacterium]